MGGRFTGWPEQAFEVLLKLDGDPPVAVRESLREEREELVRQPMIALMQDLADTDAVYAGFTVPGFHKLLEPWQQQVGFVRPERNIDQRVSFDLDGLHVRGAGWYFNPGSYVSPGREGFLAAVADDTSGPELVRIIETLRSRGYDVTGDPMQRIPKGYPAGHPRAHLLRDTDHPRAELLRHRNLVAGRHLGCEEWLHTSEAFDRVFAAFEDLRPLTSWFADHVPALPEIP
jgi:hypothetical protein